MSPPPAKRTKVEAISGDALEEDFLLEDGFAAGSDDDDGAHSDAPVALAGEEDSFAPAGSNNDASDDDAAPAPPKDEAPPAKKRKASGEKPAKKRKPEPERETVALLSVAEVVDRLTDKQKAAMPKLSGLELCEFGLRGELAGRDEWGLRSPPREVARGVGADLATCCDSQRSGSSTRPASRTAPTSPTSSAKVRSA